MGPDSVGEGERVGFRVGLVCGLGWWEGDIGGGNGWERWCQGFSMEDLNVRVDLRVEE